LAGSIVPNIWTVLTVIVWLAAKAGAVAAKLTPSAKVVADRIPHTPNVAY
jgi:hypothetical protein